MELCGVNMGDLKIFDIQDIKQKYKLDIFFETGTFYGDTVDWLIPIFDELHSVEIYDELFEKAKNRFKNESKVNIHHGNSTEVLNKILPTINRSVLFWLDAHFPGADAHKVPYNNEKDEKIRAPLYYEMQEISKRKDLYKDVIIIDDLWLYEDGPYEWGSFDDHAKKCNHNVTKSELVSTDSSFLYELLNDTHDISKVYKHQGYLIYTPKDI
jgi:hypothetical protein